METTKDRIRKTDAINRTWPIVEHPELRLVLGYEQALGYLVCRQPLDKDGITAAVMMADVAALAAADGVTLQQRLDALVARFGRHVMADKSVRMAPADGAAKVAALRAVPPSTVGGRSVPRPLAMETTRARSLTLVPIPTTSPPRRGSAPPSRCPIPPRSPSSRSSSYGMTAQIGRAHV